MNIKEYLEFQRAEFDKLIDITKRKNADYTGGTQDAFANFTRVEAMGIATTEQGFLTRMNDKMSRIASFCKNGELQVKDESVADTLRDLANYSILMLGYLESKKRKEAALMTNQVEFDDNTRNRIKAAVDKVYSTAGIVDPEV